MIPPNERLGSCGEGLIGDGYLMKATGRLAVQRKMGIEKGRGQKRDSLHQFVMIYVIPAARFLEKFIPIFLAMYMSYVCIPCSLFHLPNYVK